MLATPSETADAKSGPVWEPTRRQDSGADEIAGNIDDNTIVTWSPPLSSDPSVLYYVLRYKRRDRTNWTEEKKWLPEGVTER